MNRAKYGAKHHLLTDGNGFPFAVDVTATNVNDIMDLKPLVLRIPQIRDRKSRVA